MLSPSLPWAWLQAGKKKSSAPAPDERRKGVPWSEEEHRLFLQGLEIYGKGDWRSISRKCVLTRNPTQARINPR